MTARRYAALSIGFALLGIAALFRDGAGWLAAVLIGCAAAAFVGWLLTCETHDWPDGMADIQNDPIQPGE